MISKRSRSKTLNADQEVACLANSPLNIFNGCGSEITKANRREGKWPFRIRLPQLLLRRSKSLISLAVTLFSRNTDSEKRRVMTCGERTLI